MFCKKISCRVFLVLMCLLFAGFQPSSIYAQSEAPKPEIDPRIIQIVDEVKQRAKASTKTQLEKPQLPSAEDHFAYRRVDMLSRIQTATYSKNTAKIRAAIKDFEELDKKNASPSLEGVVHLYARHANLLDANASRKNQQADIAKEESEGSWLERYFAFRLSSHLYAEDNERQAALQKAQYAFQVIPKDETQDPYMKFARADVATTLAQLHAIQGNIEFAILNSIEYLRMTEGQSDPQTESDLVSNLIFVNALSRDHQALDYLGEQLLEISELSPSSIIGLSEYRVSQAANMAGRFEKGLEYAKIAAEKSEHPGIKLQAKINQAIAMSGLGRMSEASKVASDANINLSSQHLLKQETRRDVLYLGFLMAQAEDKLLARQLYNRQLDVTAQKFLANGSRDTTAMLAELENSRERQLERDAAAAREAQLQAMTIDRQRKLNRVLTLLVILLGSAALASYLFMKSREKLLRRLEVKTVEAASAEKLKTEFLGMISHELRTPLNGIIGISDFLANYHEDPDIREKTGIVLRSGTELLSVVESLTDMARLDAGQLQLAPYDANLSLSLAAVPSPWTELAEAKGLTFTQFIDPAITQHFVDEGRLVQCMNILLANAVRFTESGRVHLHITAQGQGQSPAEGVDQSTVTGLTVVVADTGQGMSDLVQSRLFTPFMQADTSRKRSHMGTGLNLAIAYALAKMMGGSLSVMSREGRGSEFTLNIPLAAASRKPEPAALPVTKDMAVSNAPETNAYTESSFSDVPVLERSDAPAREFVDLMNPHQGLPGLHEVEELALPVPAEGQQRILIVDDLASNRDVLNLILTSQGHSCKEAADGYAALAALERQAFDLVLLDIHMAPLDGVETLKRIRESATPYAHIPIIALTADNAATTNAACMQAGADLFLTKPVRQDELLRSITYLLQAQGARILSY